MSTEKTIHCPEKTEGRTRLVACKYRQRGCNMILPMESMSEHKMSCPFRSAAIQTHVTSSSRASPPNYVMCQFESVGCEFEGTTRELLEHECASLNSHLKFMLIFCLESDLKALKAHTKVQSVSAHLQHNIKQLSNSLRDTQGECQADHRMLISLKEQIMVLKRNLEENNQYLLEHLVATEDNLRRKDEEIAALQKQLQEKSDLDVVTRFRVRVLEDFVNEHLTRSGPHILSEQMTADRNQDEELRIGVKIMEIFEFEEKKRQAMADRRLALVSDPFVTSNCVKMKLKIFLNGDEVEGETCITVYVVILRGLNDENLNWPFRGKFTLYVFDPESRNYKFVDRFDADPNHFSFQKPCTERNIGYGFLRSIGHSELGRLVKDNKVVIKVTVDALN
ncbi:hypothetical protein CHS0354_029397 [Potamilus streckersoni]|uniref:Uncharacterized protein n=1 Tax=Potamilus streckersoni TaxID=2493646 RepID=A0AAE0STE9_9BIVA|nr:hypothetical protein CHS0354_029397 [Potamilus streckersoni]